MRAIGRRRVRIAILGMGVAVAMVAGVSVTASASEPDPVRDVILAESSAPVLVTSAGEGTDVSTSVSDTSVTESTVSISLPGASTADVVELESAPDDLLTGSGDPLASAIERGAILTSYASATGVQTLIEIPDMQSPTEFDFTIDAPPGSTLEKQVDGSIFILDGSGLPTALIDVPWAVDADGVAVPTSFRVAGNTVTQTIETSSDTAFPVVADPDFWWIVANSAGCLAEVAALSLAAAKVVQAFAKADRIIRAAKALGKYYDALGGSMDKVIGALKKWINNKGSLTRVQMNALEGLVREGGKIVFNVIGLGTCYSLITQK